MKSILLVGLPGSGKSFFGQKLAETGGGQFIDLDLLIVSREGLSIEEIFRGKGEEGFRLAESEALKSLAVTSHDVNKNNRIIATGGGIILKEENRRLLEEIGITVFLDRDPDNILSDVELADRPLLKDNPERLKDLHRARLAFYEDCADFVVDANQRRPQVAEELQKIYTLANKELSLAVIGDPIKHSLSPKIHKSILTPFLKSIEYEKIRIEKGGLQKAFQAGILPRDGFNITMPHKSDMIPFIDWVDPKAGEMNSVNTVVRDNKILKGYSTDGDGIRMAISNMGKSFRSAHVMILGTGGAAAVAAYEAASFGAEKIEFFSRAGGKKVEAATQASRTETTAQTDRTEATTQASQTEAAAQTGRSQTTVHSYDELLTRKVNGDILINSSPIGMEGVEDILGDYGFLDRMGKDPVVLDMVYHPPKTRLINEAEKRGIPAKNGLDMLIGQAISADNLYTGVRFGTNKAYRRALSTEDSI